MKRIYILFFIWLLGGMLEGIILNNGGRTGDYVFGDHFSWYHLVLGIMIISSIVLATWREYYTSTNYLTFVIVWILPCMACQDFMSYLFHQHRPPIGGDWTVWPFKHGIVLGLVWWYWIAIFVGWLGIKERVV